MARSTGTRALRAEDPRLLTGTGTSTYVADVLRPGMLHPCCVRSPVARARISGIDVSRALRLHCVHAAFTAPDLNCRVSEQRLTPNARDDPDTPRTPLAEDATPASAPAPTSNPPPAPPPSTAPRG